jgi:hypothetical protein
VYFVRGDSAEGTPYDGGSYRMMSVLEDGNGDATGFFDSHHVYLKSRSLTIDN